MLNKLIVAVMAQSVERRLGKAEVTGSIPVNSFIETIVYLYYSISFFFYVLYFNCIKIYKGEMIISKLYIYS